MSSPRVCIIILNWNGLADTVECLESLQKITYPNYNVIIVDNASRGDDIKILRDRFGDYIQIIQNDKNYGFAEGNNIGIRRALEGLNPDYLLLLNNDTIVAPDLLDQMVETAEGDPGIGILGPKIYYYDFDGRKDVIWTAGGVIRRWRPWIYDGIGNGDDDLLRYQQVASVDWVSGAAMMIKRCVLEEVSLLNPQYFFGNEDVEYCLTARRHGFRIVYVPKAMVWHKVGSTRTHKRSFSDLPPYYRLLRRNFPTRVYVYHLLILPLLLCQRGAFWLMDTLKPRKVEARESSQAN